MPGTTWTDVWAEEADESAGREGAFGPGGAASARLAVAEAGEAPALPALRSLDEAEAILLELAKLRADLARRDAITIVVVGVLLTAILQHIARMHEEFNMMASRVGILR